MIDSSSAKATMHKATNPARCDDDGAYTVSVPDEDGGNTTD